MVHITHKSSVSIAHTISQECIAVLLEIQAEDARNAPIIDEQVRGCAQGIDAKVMTLAAPKESA